MDKEDILAADVFFDFDEGLPVGERFNGRPPQFNANVSANGLSQGRVGGAAENLHRLLVFVVKAKIHRAVEKKAGRTLAAESRGASGFYFSRFLVPGLEGRVLRGRDLSFGFDWGLAGVRPPGLVLPSRRKLSVV